MRVVYASIVTVLCAFALMSGVRAETPEQLAQQVRDAENAFAATMAARDLQAFSTFLADDAIFFGESASRGKSAVVEAWKAFYEGERAPFSWRSETVEVLDSGRLAHSSGPVFDSQGRRVATFNSIWRREDDGTWKVVFDKGCQVCACPEKK